MPITSAMAKLREALIAALRSLLKGKSFIQALIAFWFNPSSCKRDDQSSEETQQAHQTHQTHQTQHTPTQPDNGHVPGKGSRDRSTATSTATLTSTSTSSKKTITTVTLTAPSSPSPSTLQKEFPSLRKPYSNYKSAADFLLEAERLLLLPVQGDRLSQFVNGLKTQFRDRLLNDAACMLPSYNHQLPTGSECGRFLSLDVGGSTLRVALIELSGPASAESMKILSMQSFKITPALKQLEGMAFFDWMAARIVEVVDQVEGRPADSAALPMGLAWSFPIEQTSLRGGILQSMGKGFRAADSLLGQDLGDIIQRACAGHGLQTELAAIVNDSAACLLSQAYVHPSTRLGLILGTGVNVAVHLPVGTVGRSKYGERPAAWFDTASHVIVNTELGMFGHGLLPVTRWDALLNAGHPKPEFQPLEHMVSGFYLGEVCRFAILEAAAATGLFGGVVPPSLHAPYSLDTETLSRMEADTSATLEEAHSVFTKAHPSPGAVSIEDVRFVRTLAQYVSQRSAAIVAASVYGLWALKVETEQELLASGLASSSATAAAELAIVQERTVVSFNGSVIERYPGYLEQCQGVINQLAASSSLAGSAIELVPAKESSLIGAAVALSCLDA
ncbi:hexokinase-1 [Ophiostoma piceae UAMH 11346]|uniref:Phosphotransferase n=1 Tax=Ophiostoma piceae (strain UAMH 11346) TaxID=1262450 RepID=S3CFN4_OPHP1|nr:hexokinase-1 [Ophiostoma piceae UAMH 11346]